MTIISISVANAQITDLDKKNFERRVRERVAVDDIYADPVGRHRL